VGQWLVEGKDSSQVVLLSKGERERERERERQSPTRMPIIIVMLHLASVRPVYLPTQNSNFVNR
jgi:hypothetical protein